ncbi:MAG: hypothetical protein IJW57_05775 [Spirochaetaceae bacterium]|nr:hypothetical protein [Spirochaetaceae bacterium]
MFEKGRKQVVHSPPYDISQPGKFDLGGLVGNVLSSLAAVAAAGVILATIIWYFIIVEEDRYMVETVAENAVLVVNR